MLASVMEYYSELGVDNIKSGPDSSNLSGFAKILYKSTPELMKSLTLPEPSTNLNSLSSKTLNGVSKHLKKPLFKNY